MKANTQNIILGGLILGGVALFAKDVYDKGKAFGEKLKITVKRFSIPYFNQGTATVPLTLNIYNNSTFGATVSDIDVKIFAQQENGIFQQVGALAKPGSVTLPAQGELNVDLAPQINLNNINLNLKDIGSSLKNILDQFLNQQPIATFRIDWRGTIEGIEQSGSEIKEVTLPKISLGYV